MGNRPSVSHTTLTLTLVDSKRQAEQRLQDAEALDFYRAECMDDERNLSARRRQVYTAQSISPKESVEYQTMLHHAIPRLPLRLQTELKDVHVVALMPSADGGMPHTRPPRVICYPMISQLSSLTTLTHELWHVHQRVHSEKWNAAFQALGWTEWKGRLPSYLEINRRFNPDTIDAPLWIYQNTWVPVPIFHDIALPNLAEVTVWFYNTLEQYHLKKIPVGLEASYPGLPHSAYEHPREMAAYALAEPDVYPQAAQLFTSQLDKHLSK